jgi:ABC-type multidrug transport system fused ATPase/permease subunit
MSALGVQLVNPVLLSHFIDKAVAHHPLRELIRLGVCYVLLSIVAQVILVAENYVAQDLAWAATNDLRTDLTRHCIKLGPTFFKNHSAGAMIERIDGDVSQLANFFSRFIVSLVSNGLLMIGIVVALAFVDWRIGLALGVIPVVGLICYKPVSKLVVARAKALRQVQTEWGGLVEEYVKGREDIKACRAAHYVVRLLNAAHARLLKAACANSVVNTALWSVGVINYMTGYTVAMIGGAWLYFHNQATLGAVYLVFNYTIKLMMPVFTIGWQLQDMQRSIGSAERILDLFSVLPEVPEGRGTPLPEGALKVEFDGVSFEYDAENPILHDVSFELPAGEILAVIGPTGSGKSTITRLIFRFYDPTKGTVRIGGVDSKEPMLSELRHRIALVSQDVQLFRGTLRENVTLFDPKVPDRVLLDAIDDLRISSWFETLPDGIDTHINGQDSLSAGEAQLVAFLRVYLKKPGLLILDEVSSRMDPVTEARVQQAMQSLMRGRTVVVIAHRMEIVRSVDKVLTIYDGRVREFGRRVELERVAGSYYGEIACGLSMAEDLI